MTLMTMRQTSNHCVAVLNGTNCLYGTNSGLVNRAGGVGIDTQSNLAYAWQMQKCRA
jgi:hypothetical protein